MAGNSYTAGNVVSHNDVFYACFVAGWCSCESAWAYAPGEGSYWDHAWAKVAGCGTSSSSSSSSSGGSSGGNSNRLISCYWDNFDNDPGVIPIAEVSGAIDAINVSFAEPSGATPGEIGFVLDPLFDVQEFIAGIQAKQARGKIIISIGGALPRVK